MADVAVVAGKAPGRARDPRIDARVLAVAAQHLAEHGYEGMSIAAVAEEAGTTRQAVYRRWPTKAGLAESALVHAFASGSPQRVDPANGPLQDLIAELEDFQRGVSRPGRLSLVGAMLQESTDATVRERYRSKIVVPRRQRIRSILDRALDQGLIDPAADLEVAVTMCTGSWYGRALAENDPPTGWPNRTALLVWRAVGGVG